MGLKTLQRICAAATEYSMRVGSAMRREASKISSETGLPSGDCPYLLHRLPLRTEALPPYMKVG